MAPSSLASHQTLVCPNSRVVCQFASLGCSAPLLRSQLRAHLSSQTSLHLQLVAERLAKLQQLQAAEEVVECGVLGEEGGSLPSSPRLAREDGGRNSQRLLTQLYQRLITLEQRAAQQEITLGRLQERLAGLELAEQPDDHPLGRHCQGTFVWRLPGFPSLHTKMRSNQAFVLWSRGFYSSVFGYRFCLRASIRLLAGEEHLGVFLHLMQGESDDCLPWPFRGSMVLSLPAQGQGLLREPFTERMDTEPGLTAFDRPRGARNGAGFGFQVIINTGQNISILIESGPK